MRLVLIVTVLAFTASSSWAVDCSVCSDDFKKCQADKNRTDCEAKRDECLKTCSKAPPAKQPGSSIGSNCANARIKHFGGQLPMVAPHDCVVVDNGCDHGVQFQYTLSGNKLPGTCVKPGRVDVNTNDCSGDSTRQSLSVSNDFKSCN
jgi:hypothetical protein